MNRLALTRLICASARFLTYDIKITILLSIIFILLLIVMSIFIIVKDVIISQKSSTGGVTVVLTKIQSKVLSTKENLLVSIYFIS